MPKKTFILIIVALLLFQLFSYLSLRSNISNRIEAQIEEIYEQNHPMNKIIVYVTTYGEKYHDDDCQYLYKSKHETTLRRAVLRGYTDCSRCSTPAYVPEYNGIDTYDEYVEAGYLDDLLNEYQRKINFLFVIVPIGLVFFVVLSPLYLKRKPKS